MKDVILKYKRKWVIEALVAAALWAEFNYDSIIYSENLLPFS